MKNRNEKLVRDIAAFCDEYGLAETTFGRLAVNDGKFVGRIRDGSNVSQPLLNRVNRFMSDVANGSRVVTGRDRRRHDTAQNETLKRLSKQRSIAPPPRSASYHDERERRLIFTNTCNEKWIVADRALEVASDIAVKQPGLRIFEANLGEGRALARLLRGLHKSHPTIPTLVVAKKHGLDDLRVSLGNMIDRFAEHPMTVMVVTNMYFREAVSFFAQSARVAMSINWKEVALEGTTAFDFQNQISSLHEDFAADWSVVRDDRGQVTYERPNVLLIYRKDHKFLLEGILPKPGYHPPQYDFILASHLYRHAAPEQSKIQHVLHPLTTSLAPGGKLLAIQSHGQNPGREILTHFWSEQDLPIAPRHKIISALKKSLGAEAGQYRFSGVTDRGSLFRYDMHTVSRDPRDNIGTAALENAWSNALYVGQVPPELVEKLSSRNQKYLEVTRQIIERYNGLWFTNEAFVVTRTS